MAHFMMMYIDKRVGTQLHFHSSSFLTYRLYIAFCVDSPFH